MLARLRILRVMRWSPRLTSTATKDRVSKESRSKWRAGHTEGGSDTASEKLVPDPLARRTSKGLGVSDW